MPAGLHYQFVGIDYRLVFANGANAKDAEI